MKGIRLFTEEEKMDKMFKDRTCGKIQFPQPPPPRLQNAFGCPKKQPKIRLPKWLKFIKDFIVFRSEYENGGLK